MYKVYLKYFMLKLKFMNYGFFLVVDLSCIFTDLKTSYIYSFIICWSCPSHCYPSYSQVSSPL